MRVDEFDYELPAARIAQHPALPRGSSRLMVLDRARGSWQHGEFRRLAEELHPGDLLVRNDARVIRARLRGERPGGGRSEEHTSELQSQSNLVCRLLLEKKNKTSITNMTIHGDMRRLSPSLVNEPDRTCKHRARNPLI